MTQPPPVPKAPPGATPRPAVTAGRVVTVEITSLHPKEVEVKLADGRTGVIPRADFTDDGPPSVGTAIEAALLAREDPRGRVPLSRAWAVKLRTWDRVQAAHDAAEPVTGTVVRAIKGGLLVDLGVRAFLPASMIAEAGESVDPSELIGSEVSVLVTEVDRDADRVVVSRRDLLRRHRRQAERDAFASLEVGTRVTGTVVGLVEYGAHVDLGGVRALLHRTEMSWGRVDRPADVLSVGDTVETVVIELSRSRRRVGLSLRRLEPDPYEAVEPGTITTATITRVVDYGAFARLDGVDVVGLVHMTELSDRPGHRPDQLVTPGETVHVKVLSVDRDKRRVALSVRQAVWG